MTTTSRTWSAVTLAVGGFLIGAVVATPESLQAAWQPIVRLAGVVGLQDARTAVSGNVLSEHETDGLDALPAQRQAELLLERSINHYRGANEQIAKRVDRWRGQIALTDRLEHLFRTAINSDDLTVRVAAVEVDIAARNLTTTAESVDRLEPAARSGEPATRISALWDLGLLGNRGVERDRVFEILMASIHDDNENVRYWAVEGLAFLATDAVIEPLLAVFHDDPSPRVRERGACSLAQSGMLSAAQRRTAVPRLLEFADDTALDDQTRRWVFQALRDITGKSLPQDAQAWRTWFAASQAR